MTETKTTTQGDHGPLADFSPALTMRAIQLQDSLPEFVAKVVAFLRHRGLDATVAAEPGRPRLVLNHLQYVFELEGRTAPALKINGVVASRKHSANHVLIDAVGFIRGLLEIQARAAERQERLAVTLPPLVAIQEAVNAGGEYRVSVRVGDSPSLVYKSDVPGFNLTLPGTLEGATRAVEVLRGAEAAMLKIREAAATVVAALCENPNSTAKDGVT